MPWKKSVRIFQNIGLKNIYNKKNTQKNQQKKPLFQTIMESYNLEMLINQIFSKSFSEMHGNLDFKL